MLFLQVRPERPQSRDGAAEEVGSGPHDGPEPAGSLARPALVVGTHRLSLGALFTFEAGNPRLSLDKRERQVLTLGAICRPCSHLQKPSKALQKDSHVSAGGKDCGRTPGGLLRVLPSDLLGPKDQLHLEGQVDHGALGSQEHQQCQEHPVSKSRRQGHQENGQEGTGLTWGSRSPQQHSQRILWLRESRPFRGCPERGEVSL